jgi:arylsulfatase A-like enzyme
MLRFPFAASLIALSVLVAPPALAEDRPPNILFIAVDDLNDWVGHLAGHPQASTPNIDRLARRGVSFTRAYAPAPLCNPSRVSLLSGVLPSKSGVYGNGERLREKLPDAVTLMQHLRAHGYTAKGGGKIFHGRTAGDPASWDEYFTPARSVGPRHIGERQAGVPESAWAPWGPLDVDDAEMFDVKVVDWTIGELNKPREKPFFLACGFTKPHLPWYVPRKYFDLHPLEGIELPATLDSDRDDLPAFGRKLAAEVYAVSNSRNFSRHGEDHAMVLQHDQWHRAVQSYLATISFVDAHVGRLLDALEGSEHAGNTIVVLWGDHGWHLGQKQHWRKHALWEVATRTTLIIAPAASTRRGATSPRPVSLIDLYPTLVELAGVPGRNGLDGQSLVPLLENPELEWPRPALTTYGPGNHSVRTERWRYIEYHDGGRELYDHDADPHEWKNLASLPEYTSVVEELAAFLPETNVR